MCFALNFQGTEQKRKKNSNKSSKKRKTIVESLQMSSRDLNTREEKEPKVCMCRFSFIIIDSEWLILVFPPIILTNTGHKKIQKNI